MQAWFGNIATDILKCYKYKLELERLLQRLCNVGKEIAILQCCRKITTIFGAVRVMSNVLIRMIK